VENDPQQWMTKNPESGQSGQFTCKRHSEWGSVNWMSMRCQ
jgi:hypothetical protein